MGQLVLKTHRLQYLKIAYLGLTTVENRSQLLEFAAQVVTFSSCLHTLHIENTNTTAADGEKFLQTLADDGFDWLKSLTIANELAWFKGCGDGCMDSLITIIAKQ